mmetsp:Transcript_162/g.672  ORF Transcript_162/g.672 Transcript_162/m.672 type:complete len:164 (-) Transcript_162:113-604(-)
MRSSTGWSSDRSGVMGSRGSHKSHFVRSVKGPRVVVVVVVVVECEAAEAVPRRNALFSLLVFLWLCLWWCLDEVLAFFEDWLDSALVRTFVAPHAAHVLAACTPLVGPAIFCPGKTNDDDRVRERDTDLLKRCSIGGNAIRRGTRDRLQCAQDVFFTLTTLAF